MYIQVRLLKGFSAPLWYKIPQCEDGVYKPGTIVQVPLRSTVRLAVVLHIYDSKPSVNFEIREVGPIEPFPQDQHYRIFLDKLGYYYQVDFVHFVQRLSHFLMQKEKRDEIIQENCTTDQQEVCLTDDQKNICKALIPLIRNNQFQVSLLHGVTGSGKTEVYKQLIKQAFSQNKVVILLAPEVSLAMQLESVLKKSISQVPVYGFHSAAPTKQKQTMWRLLIRKQPMLIIGVHLPVLLPIANLGLIIVDEEHETGYQEKKHPKINSKEAALLRARTYDVPILLGSATPSINSLYNVKHKGWKFYQLKERFSGLFPHIKTVLLTENKCRTQFWISKELELAIKDRLVKNEQVIIFLNRRGYSFFVQCGSCGFIFSCRACSVSLTLHSDNSLSCHYCDYKTTLPKSCPSCSAQEKRLIKKGIGTQQVVSILQKMFPLSSVKRADLDVSSKKKLWKKTISDFESGAIDILVGTQTIAKGFHFPKVTLVGILWADLNLNIPVYNATECALQQLIQVAGRAGRQYKTESDVIVQTMSSHPIFDYMDEHKYLNFFRYELEHRADLAYPPYGRFAEVELKHSSEKIVDKEAQKCSSYLMHYSRRFNLNVQILGPTRPPVYKVKHMHMRKIYLKAQSFSEILKVYNDLPKKYYQSSIFFTPNPNA